MDNKNTDTSFHNLNEREGNLLVRIDERTKILIDKVDSMETKLENHYVTQEEFKPVKTIAYGFVALVLTAVIGALLTIVVK